MSFHYMQDVEAWVDNREWIAGRVEVLGADGSLLVRFPARKAQWVDPFYIRPWGAS